MNNYNNNDKINMKKGKSSFAKVDLTKSKKKKKKKKNHFKQHDYLFDGLQTGSVHTVKFTFKGEGLKNSANVQKVCAVSVHVTLRHLWFNLFRWLTRRSETSAWQLKELPPSYWLSDN